MDYKLRTSLKSGDLGWVLMQHGILYASSQGYDLSFEKEIAESIVRFIGQYQDGTAKIWIADSDSGIAGTIAVHPLSERTAEIRWLMVQSEYQGKGIGSFLLSEALGYCRETRMDSIHCRNVAVNSPGIPLYEHFGFTIQCEEWVQQWGKNWLSRHYILRLNQADDAEKAGI